MTKKSGVFKSKISVSDSDFSIHKIYKDVRAKAGSLGYDFLEKQQTSKPKKYGDEIKFNFFFLRELDDFCDGEINVEFVFSSMKRGKGMDHGDAYVLVKGERIVDKDNKWGKTAFNRFLFEIYMNIKKTEFEKRYTIPISEDAGEIYNIIKGDFGL